MRISILLPALMLISGLGLVTYEWTGGSSSPDNLTVQLIPTPYIMPAVYKVYENPDALDGKYHLFRMIISNTGSQPVRNVEISYGVPNFIQRSVLKEIPLILPGQKVVVACYPSFNPDIVNRKTRSRERADIFIKAGGKERKEGFAFDMRGVNEYYYTGIPADEQASYSDMFDNMNLLPCYITPNDPVVKYYTSKIQQQILKGETAAVTKDPKEMVRFLMGIYAATLQTRMVYSSTGGIPEKKGDVNSMVQYLRLPREVITGNTGLCIELSLLYGSVLSSAGIDPYIFMIPGHAYPGIVAGGQFYAIEATGIGGEGMGGILSTDKAFERGMTELKEFFGAVNRGDERYKIINVSGLIKQGALAMELKDDDFMKKKIDDLFGGAGANGGQRFPGGASGGSEPRGRGTVSSEVGSWRTHRGHLSFSYPKGWMTQYQPVPGYPYFESQMVSPDGGCFAQVYEFPGFGNPQQALNHVRQFAAQFGQSMQYQIMGSQGNLEVIQGTTRSPGAEALQWRGYFRNNGEGVSGVIIGAMSSRLGNCTTLLNTIASSIK